MGQVQQRHIEVVAGLDAAQASLLQRSLLRSHFRGAELSCALHSLDALRLKRIAGNLLQGHLEDFPAVKDLDIGLGNRYADIVLSPFKGKVCGLKVQLGQLDSVPYVKSLENGQVRSKGERCACGVGVGVGVIGRKASSKREVLGGAGAYAGQPAGNGGVQVHFFLLNAQPALSHAYIVLQRVVYALLQGPRPLGESPQRSAEQRNQNCYLSHTTLPPLQSWGPLQRPRP